MAVKIKFEPGSFLRCHSRRNDPCDFQTQVWGCQFSPSTEDSWGSNRTLLATCGGYSACIIDPETETIVVKFLNDNKSENFYSLCWTLLEQGDLVLAVAGAKGTIHTFCLATRSLFHSFSVNGDKRSPGVFTLLFDKAQPNILYAGATDGRIYIWSIPAPSVSETESPTLLRILNTDHKSVVRTLTYVTENCIAASAEDAVFCFSVRCRNLVADVEGPTKILLEGSQESSGYIDSIVMVGRHIAVKRSDGNQIELYDLSPLEEHSSSSKSCTLQCLHKYEFRRQCQEDLYMGSSGGTGSLLACGDDDGAIWLYDTSDISPRKTNPFRKFVWPDVEDPHLFSIGAYENCINRVCFSESMDYMVGVTANNLVCIWKRGGADGDEKMEE